MLYYYLYPQIKVYNYYYYIFSVQYQYYKIDFFLKHEKSVCCSFVYLCDLILFVRIEADFVSGLRYKQKKRVKKKENVWIKRLNSQFFHSSDIPHVSGSFYSMFVVFHHMTRRRRRDGEDAFDGKTRCVENWCVSTLHSRASHKYPLLPSEDRKQRFFQMCQ